MTQAASAYARVAKTGQSGRETEASVLLNAAARIQAVLDRWEESQADLNGALTYNRRVWTILSTGVTSDESQHDLSVKQGILNLAVFIFRRTQDAMIEPAPQKLRILVSINREIAAGLRATPIAAAPASKAA
jgi:flagellar protein FlaF